MFARPAARPVGFTMVELCIVLALTVALGAVAAPSLAQLVTRHRLKDAAHGLQSDLAQARHEALRLGLPVRVSFQHGSQWCYAVSVGQPVNCHSPPSGARLLNLVHAKRYPQVQLLQGDAMALDGRSGLSLAPQGALPKVVLATAQGHRVEVRLGTMGRASLCSPADAAVVTTGVGTCPAGAAP